MSKNVDQENRATQFQKFAKALWDELVQANSYGYIDVNDEYDDGIDPTNYREVIARRAYDFAAYISAETAKRVRNDVTYYRDDEEVVDEIPDMAVFNDQLYY